MLGTSSVNVEDYHFPKKGPARPVVYKPKTHVNRYRDYKKHPTYNSTHYMVRICSTKLPLVCMS